MANEQSLKKTKISKSSNRSKRRKRKRLIKRKLKRIEFSKEYLKSDEKVEAKNEMFPPQFPYQHESIVVNSKMELWLKTYQTMTRWHQNQQLDYWHERAENLQNENDSLKEKVKYLEGLLRNRGTQQIIFDQTDVGDYTEAVEGEDDYLDEVDEYETSSEEMNDEDLDPGYLEFIKTTRQHWADRAAKRAKQGDLMENVLIV